MDNDGFAEFATEKKRSTQRDIIPTAIKNRQFGRIIARTDSTSISGTLTFYDFPLVSDNAAIYVNSEAVASTVTLTPLSYMSSGNYTLANLLTSVSISSTIAEIKVSDTLRDGTENVTAATWDGTVIQWGKNATPQTLYAGVTFTDVHLPKGAILSSAYLFFTAKGTNANTVNATIYGTKTGWSADFSASNKPSAATLTTASVAWNRTAQTDLAVVQSPDISSIVAEIANQTAWASGNRMQFQIRDNGSANGNFAEMGDFGFNTTYGRDPYLQLNFTVTLPDNDIPLFFQQYADLNSSSDTTGVRKWYLTLKNITRDLYWGRGNIRKYSIAYSITVRAYTIDSNVT